MKSTLPYHKVIDKVIAVISFSTGIEVSDILSDRSSADIVLARMAYMITVFRLFPDSNIQELVRVLFGRYRPSWTHHNYLKSHAALMDPKVRPDEKAVRYRDLIEEMECTFPSLAKALELVFLDEECRSFDISEDITELRCTNVLLTMFIGMVMKVPVSEMIAIPRTHFRLRIARMTVIKRRFPQLTVEDLAEVTSMCTSSITYSKKLQRTELTQSATGDFQVMCHCGLMQELKTAFP